MPEQLFDKWPCKYEQWFKTPLGQLIQSIEQDHIMELLAPSPHDRILDVGCGTGIFTNTYCQAGARVTGIDLSLPMLRVAVQKQPLADMAPTVADMSALPFADGRFDKTVSITALEFVADASAAVGELLRVTRNGGCLVLATLNSLSPWAEKRRLEAQADPASVFGKAYFRSPDELVKLVGMQGHVRTAIHFPKKVAPKQALVIENRYRDRNSLLGAFVVGAWTVP